MYRIMKIAFNIRLFKKSVEPNVKSRVGKVSYGYVEYMECEDDSSVVFHMKKRFSFSSYLDFKEKGLEQGITCAKILFEKLSIYANFIVINEIEDEDGIVYEFAVVESSKFFATKYREDNQD